MSASTNWEDVYRTQTARIAELEVENAELREVAAIIRNALEEYDSDGVNGNQYSLIKTVRKAINNAARKEAQP